MFILVCLFPILKFVRSSWYFVDQIPITNLINMWNKLPLSSYFIDFHKGELVEIYLTDYVTIWFKAYTNKSFLKYVKDNNKNLEGVEDCDLLKDAVDMLENVNSLVKVYIDDPTTNVPSETVGACNIHLVKRNSTHGYPVKLGLSLTEGSREMFFQKITYPLLQSSQDLLLSQEELCSLLIKKDQEIIKYKEQGVKIGNYLKTSIFEERHHKSLHSSYSKLFNFTADKIVGENIICKIKKELVCEMEQTAIKQESIYENKSNGAGIHKDASSNSIIKQEPVVAEIKIAPTLNCTQETQNEDVRVSPRKKHKKIQHL